MNLKDLQAPFPADEIEWRIDNTGKSQRGQIWAMCVAYVSARAIMTRLDDVCGPGNWQSALRREGEGFLCGIGIKVGDEWVWKWDGSDETDYEAYKGGISGALKRAAVLWGIGRYLYNLTAAFAEISMEKKQGYSKAQTKDKVTFYWLPPEIPEWALPPKSVKKPAPKPADVSKQEPPQMSRKELEAEILKTAAEINLSQPELVKWVQDEFKKPINKLTNEEMEKFLGILQGELGRQGEIA